MSYFDLLWRLDMEDKDKYKYIMIVIVGIACVCCLFLNKKQTPKKPKMKQYTERPNLVHTLDLTDKDKWSKVN